MLVATLRWREEFGVDKIPEEKFPEDTFAALGKNFGKDKDGRPVTYNMYGGDIDMKEVFGDVQRFLRYVLLYICIDAKIKNWTYRWRVGLMERSIELLNFETHDQVVQIHGKCTFRCITWISLISRTDYDGVSLTASRDPNQKAAASEASSIFQNYYPEFLVRQRVNLDVLFWPDS